MVLDIVISTLVIICLILIWIMLFDSNRFVIREEIVANKQIRKDFRAVVLADLHNKKYGKDNEKLLQAIRNQKPDVIFVAGDMIEASPGRSMETGVAFLGELAKKYPICYGNGNHEHRLKLYPETYGTMAQELAEEFRKIGLKPLVNEKVLLEEYGVSVYGLEIEREYYKRFKTPPMTAEYVTKELGNPEKNTFNVLLAHNPLYFEQYAKWGADLVLSGHVHGGIVRVPIWGKGIISPSLRLFPKYDGGVFTFEKTKMILSRGLGAHTIPIRLFNPGELWVVDFKHES